MIFGRNFINGHHFILVGLSDENLWRLQSGEPISVGPVKNDPVLENSTILIMVGNTEPEITEKLKKAGLVPPETSTT